MMLFSVRRRVNVFNSFIYLLVKKQNLRKEFLKVKRESFITQARITTFFTAVLLNFLIPGFRCFLPVHSKVKKKTMFALLEPGIPQKLRCSTPRGPDRVTLAWDPVQNSPGLSYEIYEVNNFR